MFGNNNVVACLPPQKILFGSTRFTQVTYFGTKTANFAERFAGLRYNGLKNQGATGYLNSVLQCLYMTEDFRREVENFRRDPLNPDEESADLMQELQKLFKRLKEVVGTTEGITRCLHISSVREQQNAVEYYQKILQAIGPEVSKIFKGEMSNKTRCACTHIFQEKCSFFTIPLSIEAAPTEWFSVNKGLENFFKEVKFDEDNLVYCDHCDQKAEAETWTEIEEVPNILTLYLKRFHFDYYQMKLVKNHCPIVIPMQLLLKKYKYELYAVINHIGEQTGGHYNAVIRSFDDNEWYCFDDSFVQKVSEEAFHRFIPPLVYLLMYRKIEVDEPHSDEKSTESTNELQLHWQEYYELVINLLNWIRNHIIVFENRNLPTSYEDIEVLFHLFKTELPEKEKEKNGSKHAYNYFENAVQAGKLKVHPGYHPSDVEKEWDRLWAAILKWKRKKFEGLVQRQGQMDSDSDVHEEWLNQMETLLHMAEVPEKIKKSQVCTEERAHSDLTDNQIDKSHKGFTGKQRSLLNVRATGMLPKEGKQRHIEHCWSENNTKKAVTEEGLVGLELHDKVLSPERAVTMEDSKDLKIYSECARCISGVYVEATKERLSIYQAEKKNMITKSTAFQLLEAQASNGYVIDPISNRKLSVTEAVEMGVVSLEVKKKLLSAERAVTGYNDPFSGTVISVFQAMNKGLIVKSHGIRLLKFQIATGGIIDPKDKHRLPVEVAYNRGLFDEEMKRMLTDPSCDTKGFFDPNTKRCLTYPQMMEQCITDSATKLSFLLLKEKEQERKTYLSV
ncbi:plectin-like isoform X2 [Neoarius graeffei]|uniref:plectin-like isoform X2 n=1 Tax=Neoarius graeffei TaxID=443677 RepID=UPI00298D04BE|nr:plectin-like isoform X2 [Neoarius graeffei]